MKVFIAAGSWGIDDSTEVTKEVGKFDLDEVVAYCKSKDPSFEGIGDKLFSLSTSYKYHSADKALKRVAQNGKAVNKQDGNNEGWGFSTNSMKEAVAVIAKSVLAYRAEKAQEQSAADTKIAAIVNKLRELPKADLSRNVYFYFKQDYDYRAMDRTFSGKLKLREFVAYVIDFLTEVRDGPNEKAMEKYAHSMDWYELVVEQNNVVALLLKKSEVSTVGEIGYHALSLKSIAAAKQLVKDSYIEEEFD